jgi:hypothetical protein
MSGWFTRRLVDHGRNFLSQTGGVGRTALVVGLVLPLVGCAPARGKAVGRTAMVMAIGGVATMITSAAVSRETYAADLMFGGSVLSAAGILLYVAHEMSGPEIVYVAEPEPIKLMRWARILTEHAAGAARRGNCVPVRKFEPRVRVYDANYHDSVFMRDPEILRCFERAPRPGDN